MRELLIKVTFYVVASIVYVILLFLATGQRIGEWLDSHKETARQPKKDPIIEHEKHAPHKH
jgi:hypothetical protein